MLPASTKRGLDRNVAKQEIYSCRDANFAAMLVGSIVEISCSPTRDGGKELPRPSGDKALDRNLLTRVAKILGIDRQRLEDAFAQARSEMPDEAPRRRPFNRRIINGTY